MISSVWGADLAAGCWASQVCHSRRRSPAWPSPARPAHAACPGAPPRAGPRPGRRRRNPAGFEYISSSATHSMASAPTWHCCARSQTERHRCTPANAVLLGARLCACKHGAAIYDIATRSSATRATLPTLHAACEPAHARHGYGEAAWRPILRSPVLLPCIHTPSRQLGVKCLACNSAPRNGPLRSLPDRVQEAAQQCPQCRFGSAGCAQAGGRKCGTQLDARNCHQLALACAREDMAVAWLSLLARTGSRATSGHEVQRPTHQPEYARRCVIAGVSSLTPALLAPLPWHLIGNSTSPMLAPAGLPVRGHLHDERISGGKGECKRGFGFRIAHPKAIAICTHLLVRSRLHVCPPPQHTSIVITSKRRQAGISPDAEAGRTYYFICS